MRRSKLTRYVLLQGLDAVGEGNDIGDAAAFAFLLSRSLVATDIREALVPDRIEARKFPLQVLGIAGRLGQLLLQEGVGLGVVTLGDGGGSLSAAARRCGQSGLCGCRTLMRADVGFTGARLDRADRERNDPQALAAALADRQPNKLTTALDAYFRLQTIEWEFDSILEAVRRYQNPAIADLMVGVLRGNSANRDALREFITDLAARKELEFTVISQDAQACRVQLSKIPTAKQPAGARSK